MRWVSALSRAVTRLEELCLAWGILAIAALTITNVLLRAVFGQSLLFAMELSRFLIVLVTFVGIGYAAGKGRHIRMTALYDALGTRARKAIMLLITGSTAALLFALAWLSLRYVLGTVRELGAVSPVLQVPSHLPYLAAPLGSIGTGFGLRSSTSGGRRS
jgi:TRAP-type C4-dicarboxylate transport system permease small subunit